MQAALKMETRDHVIHSLAVRTPDTFFPDSRLGFKTRVPTNDIVGTARIPTVAALPGAAGGSGFTFHRNTSGLRPATGGCVGRGDHRAISVLVEDEFNQIVTSGSPSTFMGIGANSSGGILSGASPVRASGGSAAFNDLSVDQAGTGYTLVASVTSLPLPAVGVTFDTGNGPGTELAVQGFSWGGAPGVGTGPGHLQDFKLILDPSNIEPGLWRYMLGNLSFQAVVHVRDGSGHEYLTTFKDSAFNTAEIGDATQHHPRVPVLPNYRVLTNGSVHTI